MLQRGWDGRDSSRYANAANEVAVAAFEGKLPLDISALNSDLLAAHQVQRVPDIETVFQVDAGSNGRKPVD